MENSNIIPKLPEAVFLNLSEEVQDNLNRLRENGLAQQKRLQEYERTLGRIFPTKEPDKMLFTISSLGVALIKFAMEAETDYEREFALIEAY